MRTKLKELNEQRIKIIAEFEKFGLKTNFKGSRTNSIVC